jgi:Secretion system C-terminal sorting domain
MKKLFLLIFVFGIISNSQALFILDITVTNSGINDINLRTKVFNSYTFNFYSWNYEILNGTITLNICFNPGFGQAYTTLENDFIIPNINLTAANYTLIVNVKNRQYLGNNLWTCDSTIGFDTETIQFSTPVTNAVSLGNTTFVNTEQKINLFPNPATTTFEIKNVSNLQSISIYDNLGRRVKEFLRPENIYDISDLNSGIYYIKIKDSNGSVFDVKLIKK